jgi:hypothetical protein
MYQKPDFVKVSLKVSDIFASYLATGCPEDEFVYQTHVVNTNCKDTDQTNTFTGVYQQAHHCYSEFNP